MSKHVLPKNAANVSVVSILTPQSALSSMILFVKAAGIAQTSQTASRLSQKKPSLVASVRLTNLPVIKTFRV